MRGEGSAHGVRELRGLSSRCRLCHEDIPHGAVPRCLANGVGCATRTSNGAVPPWLSSRCGRCHTASLSAPVGSSSSATR